MEGVSGEVPTSGGAMGFVESNLGYAVVGLIGVIIGAVGGILGQFVNGRLTERREERQAVREQRRERAKSILDALDRAAAVYSMPWIDIEALMEQIGYSGEEIGPERRQAYEEERRNRLKQRLDRLIDDFSSVARIPDPEIRDVLYRALSKGITRPEVSGDEHLREIDDAYRILETWIARPPAGKA